MASILAYSVDHAARSSVSPDNWDAVVMDQANTASGSHGLHTGLFSTGPCTYADKDYALIRCRDFVLKVVNAIERTGVVGS